MTEGSLRNFPTVDNLEDGLCNRRVAVEYRHLYERLKNGDTSCWHTKNFRDVPVLRVANRFIVSIAIALNHLSPKKPILWNYGSYFLSASR